jgi:type I restriction enzyme, S subunit
VNFPRYPSYKESGVQWLPRVPTHWRVERLKRVVRLQTEKTDAREHPVALENIESWTGRFVASNTSFEGDGIAFQSGDLLFGKLRPYLAKVYLADSTGEAVGDFHVMRPLTDLSPSFGQYQFLTREFIDTVNGSTFGAKMPRASWDFVGNMPVAVPPLNEQQVIAAFLANETSKIEAVISEQKLLIELLADKRQAVISHAVTKGLNPNAPMKPSGVAWLEDLPAHWRLLRLKNISPRLSGRLVYQPAQYFSDEGVPFLMGNNVTERGIDWTDIKRVPEEINRTFSHHALKEGDVITVRVGAPGVTCVVPKEAEGLNCGSLMIIRRSPNFDSNWLASVMNSFVIRTQIDMVQYGAAQEQINITDAVNFVVPTPDLAEQRAIATHVRQQAETFDSLKGHIERAIALLEERRAALISAGVTGRIDVRQMVEFEPA